MAGRDLLTTKRLNYYEVNPKAIKGLAALNKHTGSIDDRLRALVELRVSQINGCAYCVDLHANEARAAGESQQRLDGLPAWRESPFFTEAERAALAWAEAVTLLPETHAPDALYEGLRAHFTDEEVVDLTLVVALINTWNRIAVGFRRMPVERST